MDYVGSEWKKLTLKSKREKRIIDSCTVWYGLLDTNELIKYELD